MDALQKVLRQDARRAQTFRALDVEAIPPSVANLPTSLTINGVTKTPVLEYLGVGGAATLWTPGAAGNQLTKQSTGSPAVGQTTPLFGANDLAVGGDGSFYYDDQVGTTIGDLGTDDWVLVMLVRHVASKYFAAKSNEAGSRGGWIMETGVANYQFALWSGNTGISIPTGTITANAWQLFHLFGRRASYAQWYEAGVASGAAVDISAKVAGDASGTGSPLTIFGRAGGAGGAFFTGQLAMLRLYRGAGWLDTHLQETVAKTQTAQLLGIYPSLAKGTALPSVMTRASAAYLDKVEASGSRKLYYVGSNWIRTCSRPDSGGTTRRGALIEPSQQNLCLQSHTFATTWSPQRASVPTTAVVCPDGVTRTTSTLHEDGTAANTHLLWSGAIAITNGTYCFSLFAKAGLRSWIEIRTRDYCVGGWGNFNLSTGAKGSTGNASAGIESWGNGWYRIWVVGTNASGSVNEVLQIAVGEADADITFNGLDQDSLSIFGAQFTTGNCPGSYIPTTAAAVTRSADALRYAAASNWPAAGGVVEFETILANCDRGYNPAGGGWYALALSDGTANNRVMVAAATGNDDFPTIFSVNGGVIQAQVSASSDIWNGALRKISGTLRLNNVRIRVDGAVEGTPDSSCTIPSVSQIDVGGYISAGYELGGLIRRLRIFKR